MNPNHRHWIAFNMTAGVGAARARLLLEKFGTLEMAWNASDDALMESGLDKRTLSKLLLNRKVLDLEAACAAIDAAELNVLTWDCDDYPRNLRKAFNCPPVIFTRGGIKERDNFAVAIVGTRTPTSKGIDTTKMICDGLARKGVTIVSGLARGVDAVAHDTTLNAGGRTLAVLGFGMDNMYPSEHTELAARIAQQGALVTDFPLGTNPDSRNFPARNRIISGLALATVVVESLDVGGSLITARYALAQDRQVMAVPGDIFSAFSRGTNELIKNGAQSVTSAEEIMARLEEIQAEFAQG